MSDKVSFRIINRLAIPSILAGIIEPIISISDAAIIGHVHLNPTESLAAVGIVGSFISALFWILAQTKNAISSIVSQKFGSKKLSEIKTLISQVLLINVLLGIGIVFTTKAWANDIFQLYSAKNLILEYAVSYYDIRVFGLLFTLITFSLFGVFRGLQNTYWAMNISIIGGAINIILDFVLVYGVPNYIPAMHIAGAAWASVFAQFVMMLLSIYVFLRKTPFKWHFTWSTHPEIPYFLSLTGNLIIRTIALNVAIFLSNRYATSYGKNYIAAHVILTNIWLFTAFFLDGYADAGNSLSGRFIGEKDYSSLKQVAKKLLKYSLYVSVILSFSFIITYPLIGKIFTSEKEVLQIFKHTFWLVLLMQPIGAIAFIFDGIYKGLGWVKFLRNIQLIATFFIFIPSLLLLDNFNFKLIAVWISFTLWMTFRAVSLYIYFNKHLQQVQKSKKVKKTIAN